MSNTTKIIIGILAAAIIIIIMVMVMRSSKKKKMITAIKNSGASYTDQQLSTMSYSDLKKLYDALPLRMAA